MLGILPERKPARGEQNEVAVQQAAKEIGLAQKWVLGMDFPLLNYPISQSVWLWITLYIPGII